MNRSPWIAQLDRMRAIKTIGENIETDITIVGAGIAGITSAYFILTCTNLSVTVVDAYRVAHGATGHNAGQITSYFEMPFKEMVEKFGLESARLAQKLINEDARMLLERIVIDVGLKTPFSQFLAYDGWINHKQVMNDLENLLYEEKAGVRVRQMLIANEWLKDNVIDEKYSHLYTKVSQNDILDLLESRDDKYIAATPFLSGCMNSAMFSEEILQYLLLNYGSRIKVYEHSPVNEIHLFDKHSISNINEFYIKSKYVLLCTNGFETLTIYEGEARSKIDTKYHKNVSGVIGFMGAYLEKFDKPPFTASYNSATEKETHIITDSLDFSDPYFYTTRRPYERFTKHPFNLISIGGPDRRLPELDRYDKKMSYPAPIKYILHKFAKSTYGIERDFDFYWHGLMGYTSTGFRIIGSDPNSKLLLYNLGCNGVGILPSIYGSYRISQILNNENIEPTIFDPN